MDIQSSAMTITDGPLTGWDITLTHIEHGVDVMDDLYTLELWPPDADQAAHTFQTYRYAYGWAVIQAAVPGGDAQTQAALDWWTANNDSPAYATHRILVAIDENTWATRAELAQRLGLTHKDLDPASPYGQALATAEQRRLVTWREHRATPLVALTPTAYDLIHPDKVQAVSGQRHRRNRSNTDAASHQPDPGASAAPRVAKAFRELRQVSPHLAAASAPLPPAGPVRPTRSRR